MLTLEMPVAGTDPGNSRDLRELPAGRERPRKSAQF